MTKYLYRLNQLNLLFKKALKRKIVRPSVEQFFTSVDTFLLHRDPSYPSKNLCKMSPILNFISNLAVGGNNASEILSEVEQTFGIGAMSKS